MAGIKARKGTVQIQPKYFVKGREVKPCQVHQKKIFSNGYKMLRGYVPLKESTPKDKDTTIHHVELWPVSFDM